ncbi:hypothetical protein [Actinomadura formosensis]|uniref:hypothetical protein n=1 Tax=Actinomadura formosensis TaxID=60706 RepID=UPI000831E920|nr:hypothetical protein [Actinomadura formosensis]
MPKNKTWQMLTRTPRTHEELAFRTHMRLGAMAIVGLAVVVLIKLWWLVLIVAAIAFLVWLVKQAK